jgi:hypothetical protein
MKEVLAERILFELPSGLSVERVCERHGIRPEEMERLFAYAARLVRGRRQQIEESLAREERWRKRLGERERAIANDGVLNLLEAILLEARAEIHRALAEADEHL